jgi:hypothetical protein
MTLKVVEWEWNMINEHDIKDMWDKETQEAYLKWAKEYGVPYDPWFGQPAVSAAWIAAVKWYRERKEA